MRLTIVRDDNMVGINGRFYNINLSDMSDTIRAVQWIDDRGFIERSDYSNDEIDNIKQFQNIVDEWNVLELKRKNKEKNPYIDLKLPDAKAAKIQELSARFEEEKNKPIDFKGNKFSPSDGIEKTLKRFGKLSKDTVVPNARKGWDTSDNSEAVPLTLQELRDLSDALYDKEAEVYEVKKMHIDNINKLTATIDVASYNINTGWK